MKNGEKRKFWISRKTKNGEKQKKRFRATPATNDVWFSYLPMAHVFERTVHIIMMYTGAKCAFSSGNLRQINQELGLARPTFFGAVPRTLNKLYEKVNETISAPGKVRTRYNLGLK